jgi:hypothetical protein
MTIQNKSVWIVGLIVAAVITLKLGVPLGTLLVVGALLLCCGPMLFMISGKNQRSRGDEKDQRSDEPNSWEPRVGGQSP